MSLAPSRQAAAGAAHFRALKWRFVGPLRGGRVVAVAGDPVNAQVFYFGSTGGGVWKTTDGGNYWENVSDGFFKRASVGALDVAPSDPNVIYAGMGETTIRGNVSHGDGVYRSLDAGRTWQHMGLAATRNIAKVRAHPHNPELVYVAAFGHAHGPNSERGVYRSSDGGKSWQQVLFRSENAGAIDLTLDPTNPRVIYAAFWEARRNPYSLTSGGPGSGIFRSTDGGDTWQEISRNEGLPRGLLGKIGIVASAAKAGRVWAIVEAEDGAVFRSDDWGETWQRGSEDRNLRQRAWYYQHIYADPLDPNTVWVLNVECWRSTDAGQTFQKVAVPHGDNHDLWIDPRNPLRMINGNDGGGCVSFNGGETWSDIYNQPTAEMYHVTTDNQIPYRLYGAQQDNTTISVPSRSMLDAITRSEAFDIGGGESGYIQVDPRDPNIIYAGSYGGYLTRHDRRTGQYRVIDVWPEESIGSGAEARRYRFQWTYPILISPHDADVLYVTSQHVHRSRDGGSIWEVISPDLTVGDPETLKPSGGPITKDNTGAETYATIFALAESPIQPGVLWAGSDDGLIHVSRDGGQNWVNVTPPDLPERALISIIDPSPHDPAAAYVAATRYKHDDFAPYLFRTGDFGQSWTKITGGIPGDDFTRVIREDPGRQGLLYAGTETGVYISLDDGGRWERFQQNLPVVPIHDLIVKGSDLVAGTHGRGFWILDDLTPLHQMSDDSANSAAFLFKPRPGIQFRTSHGFGSEKVPGVNYDMVGATMYAYKMSKNEQDMPERVLLDAGYNPPDGVVVIYALKNAPEDEVTLTFLDEAGKEIKSFGSRPKPKGKGDEGPEVGEPAVAGEAFERPTEQSATLSDTEDEEKEPTVPKQAGLNRFVWDMRYARATKIPGDKSMEFVGGATGPLAPPGTYQVRLSFGGQSLAETFELRKDPRVETADGDLKEQFDLLLKIRDKLSQTHETIIRIRRIRDQAQSWEKRFNDKDDAKPVVEAAKGLSKSLTEIEEELIQTKAKSRQDTLNYPIKLNAKLSGLASVVGSATAKPTRQSYEVFDHLSAQVDTQIERLNQLLSSEAPKFNDLVREQGLMAIDTA